jgi:uncharacterized protein (TIGR03067 family)
MTRLFACLLCTSLSLSAMAPIVTADEAKKAAIREDRKRIEGRWRVAELVVNGNVAKEDDARKLVVVNEADGTWQLFSEGKQVSKGTSTIDPTKDPKTIDFSPTEGEAKGKQFQGIYMLDEKTRKLTFAPADKGRPSEFSSLPGSEHVLVKFERENGEARSTTATSTAMRVQKNVAYVEDGHERHKLDVYSPTNGENHPVIFWIHGGGWQAGDKSSVQVKPQAFVDKGFVFVSTNYRLLTDATIKQMGEDLAKAIRWVHGQSKEHGGNPDQIFVMGHSAGAQLAALVCTDDRYLKAEGVVPTIIKGCVPVDGDTYDVPAIIETADRPVDELSGGERQRVWLATCLAQDTELLLLHEPTTFLDLRNQVEILDLVRDLAGTHQVAVGLVLHDLNQAAEVADRVVLLSRGRVHATGTPAEVFTEDTLSEIYGIRIAVDLDPQTGRPHTRPVGRHTARLVAV